MNLETIIFNTVLVVLCIIPFILMGRFQQKRKNQLLKSLTDLAVTQNCKITYKEFCGEIVIGLDESNNFLFFMRRKKADIGEDGLFFSKDREGFVNLLVVDQFIANNTADGSVKIVFPHLLDIEIVDVTQEMLNDKIVLTDDFARSFTE
jgi:hypothetical protein